MKDIGIRMIGRCYSTPKVTQSELEVGKAFNLTITYRSNYGGTKKETGIKIKLIKEEIISLMIQKEVVSKDTLDIHVEEVGRKIIWSKAEIHTMSLLKPTAYYFRKTNRKSYCPDGTLTVPLFFLSNNLEKGPTLTIYPSIIDGVEKLVVLVEGINVIK